MQIEARVDQQTDISRELSLWGQRGSRVIRGNLLVIPISDTFIYVEPVYLEAKQEESELPSTEQPQPRDSAKPRRRSVRVSSQQDKSRGAALPELKRVIVAFSNRLVMEENLDKALSSVLDVQISAKQLPRLFLKFRIFLIWECWLWNTTIRPKITCAKGIGLNTGANWKT
jgi:uncharacterized membrane protein (UPF0182 family)